MFNRRFVFKTVCALFFFFTLVSFANNTEINSKREMPPWIVFERDEKIVSPGDNDEIIDVGESIDLPFRVRNTGIDTAYSLRSSSRIEEPNFIITNSIKETNSSREMSWIVFEYCEIIDSTGDDDGIIDPGESIELPIGVRNAGVDVAYSLTGTLRTTDPNVTMTDSVEEFGDVPPGSVSRCLDAFRFDVSADCPSSHAIDFELVTIDADERISTNAFSIFVLSGDIFISVDTLDFETAFIGYSDTLEFQVVNIGSSTLEVNDISSDNSDYTVDITSFILLPGEDRTVRVMFEPVSEGISAGSLTVQSDLSDVTIVFLWGEGLEPPDISVSPVSFDVSLSAGETSNYSLTLYNMGGSELDFFLSPEGINSMYALKFDGVNYVKVPDHPTLSAIGGAFTLEFWMMVEEDPFKKREVLGKWGGGGSSDDEYNVDFLSTGVIELAISGADGLTKIGSNPILPYTWIHVAEVFDSKSSSYKLFINGVLESSVTPSLLTMNRDTEEPFCMGTYDFGYYAPNFKGQLDEVRIWNVARTQAEIQESMYREPSGTEPGLIGYWKFDEGSGNIAYDFSPNNNDGTCYGEVARVVSQLPVVWLSVDAASGTVSAGNSVNIEVTFDATDLYGGDYDADIVISNNDPDEPKVIIPTHFHVIGVPDIAVSEDTIDYGTVFAGYSSTDTLIVYNEGTDSLTISNISSDNSDFVVNVTNFSLASGKSQEVEVTFTPSTTGAIAGILTITSDDPDESPLSVYLEGECIEPPDISISTDMVNDSLFAGNVSVDTLTIYNTGESDLIFYVSFDNSMGKILEKLTDNLVTESKQITGKFEYLEVGKNETDPHRGNPVIFGAGGPDSYGYNWVDSDEPFGCKFEWVDIRSTGGILVTGLSNDNYVGPYPISFGFPFYGSVYTEFYICSNGFIGFGPPYGYTLYNNKKIPTSSSPNNIIAWCWDDLYLRGSVYYQDFGDRLIIQFVNQGDMGKGRINAEIIIYRSGAILIQYVSVTGSFDISGNTIGIENIKGTDGLQVAFNTAYIHSSLAVEIMVRPIWLSANPIAGIVMPGDSANIEVIFNATNINGGDYFADINIMSNDPEEQEIIIPARLHVTGIPDIAISEDSFDLGNLFVGFSITDTLIITNEGTDSLTVSNISSDNSDFGVDKANFTLDPLESQEIIITFTPSVTGDIAGTLTIESDDPDETEVNVILRGEGLSAPVMTVEPEYLSDTLTTGESANHILTIGNTGGNNLIFEIMYESIEGAGPTVALNKNQITLSLKSKSTDLLNQTVMNQSNEKEFQSEKPEGYFTSATRASYTGDYLQFNISNYGEVIPFQYPVGTEHLRIGDYLSGYTICYNDGGDKVEWAGCEDRSGIITGSYNEIINDVDSAVIDVITQTSGGELTITQRFTFDKHDQFIRNKVNIENMSGTTLNNIIFKKWADWDMDGDYRDDNWGYDITHNMIYAWDEHYCAIAGQTLPDYRDIEGWDDYNRIITDEDYIDGLIMDFDGLEILHYELGNLSPGEERSLTFAYGAADNLIELKSVIERGIVGAERFAANPDTGTVPTGDSSEIEVTFDAASLYSGDYYANLIISSNCPITPLDTVFCFLHVIGVPVISTSSDTLEFSADSTDTLNLQVHNTGTDTLMVTNISSDNSDFVVDITNFILLPNGSKTIKVIFTPTSGGQASGILTIQSNDPDKGTYTVALIGDAMGGVEENIPKAFFVSANHPNPFCKGTVIKYGCPERAKVSLQVFDIMGRLVKTLVDKEMDAGYHEVHWDGSTNSCRKVASAVYFYRMQADDFKATKKMIFAK